MGNCNGTNRTHTTPSGAIGPDGSTGTGRSPTDAPDENAGMVKIVPSTTDNTLNFSKSIFPSKPNEYEYLFKLLLIGNSGVGKSSILLRFADDRYDAGQTSTIGVDFKIRTIEIDDKRVKLQIWDTAGQERFKTVTKAYFRGSHGIMLVYDITSMKTFDGAKYWLKELQQHAPTNCIKILVGNKCDTPEEDRQVTFEDGKKFAEEENLFWMETSAKDNTNVGEAFAAIAKGIMQRIS
eukprot:TRINITY_DN14717_c0_g1_i1.p1 TRINITY_DN14717_c0_g1~~TRINITY_DN14717_c0_g1_i1.p1  ORF type:complete len:237 (-),score=50.12 TRINITY_DN14717_c0_g1_i1:89-799(-)